MQIRPKAKSRKFKPNSKKQKRVLHAKTRHAIQSFTEHFKNLNGGAGDENERSAYFYNLDNVVDMRRMGSDSVNSVVNALEYDDGSFAVLKTSKQAEGDNLMYELAVGSFVNHLCRVLPNFIRTYGAFTCDASTHAGLLESSLGALTSLSDLLDYNSAKACDPQLHTSLLVEHVTNPISVFDLSPDDLSFNLIGVLFQVYFALSSVCKVFTHYDLHDENVLLYARNDGKHLDFVYVDETGQTASKCKYAVKIIDYGHSFFVDKINNTSSAKLIKEAACRLTQSGDYVNPLVSNCSHDLRFFYICKTKQSIRFRLQKNKLFKAARLTLDMLNTDLAYESEFGTPSRKSQAHSKTILNVADAYRALTHVMRTNKATFDEGFASSAPAGTLTVNALTGFNFVEASIPKPKAAQGLLKFSLEDSDLDDSDLDDMGLGNMKIGGFKFS